MKSHTVYIAGSGYYTYDADLFRIEMGRTRAELLREVLDRCDASPKGFYRKLYKDQLAAMLADFATGNRENERHATAIWSVETDPAYRPVMVADIGIHSDGSVFGLTLCGFALPRELFGTRREAVKRRAELIGHPLAVLLAGC